MKLKIGMEDRIDANSYHMFGVYFHVHLLHTCFFFPYRCIDIFLNVYIHMLFLINSIHFLYMALLGDLLFCLQNTTNWLGLQFFDPFG